MQEFGWVTEWFICIGNDATEFWRIHIDAGGKLHPEKKTLRVILDLWLEWAQKLLRDDSVGRVHRFVFISAALPFESRMTEGESEHTNTRFIANR